MTRADGDRMCRKDKEIFHLRMFLFKFKVIQVGFFKKNPIERYAAATAADDDVSQ